MTELDDLAAVLWRTEAENVGAPASVASGRTREAFDEQSDGLKAVWRKFAKAALSVRTAHSSGVKVLEWREAEHIDDHTAWCATSIIGEFVVGFDDGWYAMLDDWKWEWEPDNDPRTYEGPSAGQAACQAYFEARILSALSPAEPCVEGDAKPVAGSTAPSGCAFDNDHLAWACEKWQREVSNRPLRNVHRRTLDDTWRQVIRRLGGDPSILLPMADHDTLVAENPEAAVRTHPSLLEEWRGMDSLPETGLVIVGCYNGKGQWCAEVADVVYVREHLSEIASGVFSTSPHLAFDYTHWTTLPDAPSASKEPTHGN